LAKEFADRFQASPGRHLIGQTEVYQGGEDTGNRFSQIADVVCKRQPDVVYFAGRGTNLTEFVAALDYRPCEDRVTVLSGDDTTQMRPEPEVDDALNGAGGRVPVVLRYTALAHPLEWTGSGQRAAEESFGALRTQYYNQFPDAAQNSLDDGEAITAHDAVLTAVKAIRDGLNPRDPLPSP